MPDTDARAPGAARAVDHRSSDGTSWITLVAADRGNPVTVAMAAELLQAVRQARREDAHVIVLQAVGRAFCVGGDVRGSG